MVAKTSKSEGVTRIKASGGKSRAENKAPKKTTSKTKKQDTSVETKRHFFSGFFGYFTGAWVELRQVHWPTRRSTWGMTGAVLAFSGFFVAFILLLDIIFKTIFEAILK